ncbi:MAG: hypothetical protein LBE13_14090 [Bacteroidales bacterium]|jgi:hypothetical protein|nr:hypothetical protein [Bacteroidales bacterium]
MEQEDYLKKQIEQMGRTLGAILSNLIGSKNAGKINEGIEITNQALKTELDFDIQEVMDIRTDDFIDIFISEKKFTSNSFEKLAEILLLIADNKESKEKELLYEKCLIIFEYLERVENTYSLDRQRKIEQIKEILSTSINNYRYGKQKNK